MSIATKTFCTLCDPSLVLATSWCTECNDFLCSECNHHHEKSKASKNHSILVLDEHNKLPQFVKDLQFVCDDHDQRFDSFCSVHNSPCCIRCALTSHKSCLNVTPLDDLISYSKTSPAMLDLESAIADLSSYLQKLTSEIKTHKQDITEQEKKIRNDITEQRKAVNDHLDQLEKNLLENLQSTFATNLAEIELILSDIKEIDEKVERISSDMCKIKTHASDAQSFFSLACLQSMIAAEEKCLEHLQGEEKLMKKNLDLINKTGIILSVESLGDIKNKTAACSTRFLKQKEKEAQLVDDILNVTNRSVTLQLVNSLSLSLGGTHDESNIVSGCAVTGDGNILTSEYNGRRYWDRVSLHDCVGKFIQAIEKRNHETMYDLSNIWGTSPQTFLVSVNNCIRFYETRGLKEIRTIKMDSTCYSATGYQENIFWGSSDGISKYNTNRNRRDFLFESKLNEFSFMDYHDKKLYFTRGKGCSSVSCCDDNGKHLWTYEDTEIIREARGVVVIRSGYVLVAGNESNNIVCLSLKGNLIKEVQKISSPLTLSYDENRFQLIVCTESSVGYIFKVCDN